jgi:transposase
MPPCFKIDKKEIKEIIDQYLSGLSSENISKQYNVSGSTINRLLKRNNIKIRQQIINDLDNKVVDLYNDGISIKKISQIYKCTKNKVSQYLKDNNIEIRSSKDYLLWEPENIIKEEIIKLYSQGMSARQLGIKFGVSDITITNFLKNNNIETRKHNDSNRNRYGYGLDETVFDEINEESAYWIGFIISDGNIYKGRNSNSINFGVNIKDKEHLEKLKKFMKCDKPLYFNKNAAFIAFHSKKLQDKLAEFGIGPRKSNKIKTPEILKNNRHFWRGMIDGDGWVYDYKTGPRIGLCGTIDIINNFNKFINKNNKIRKPYKDNDNFGTVDYNGFSAISVIKLLYNNSNIYLDRKFNEYQKIINKCV